MSNTRFLLLGFLGIGLIFQEVNLSPDFYWRDYNHGDVPYDAFEAYPGLYIGQTHFSKGLIPAAIYPYRDSVAAMYGPRVDVTKHVKILCTLHPKNLYWDTLDLSSDNINVTTNAVVGGFQEKLVLHIGLVNHLGNWKIGKASDINDKKLRGVFVWDNNGSRVILKKFMLLKYKI